MPKTILFAGPDADYSVTIPDATSLEDVDLSVVGRDGQQAWRVEVDEIDADGIRTLSGLTRGDDVFWFELQLGESAEVRYWSDRILVRMDRAR